MSTMSTETGATHPRRPLIEVHRLEVRFGEVPALRGLDLEVSAGQALALVGRNGAGKSSTLRVLAGVLPADAGQVQVAGVDVRRDPLAAKRVTGYCPDVGGLLPRATPMEHLQLAARLRGMSDWRPRALDLLDRFELLGAADRITTGFSHGMSRRLSVLLAAFHAPPVLLLDEPFDGVDPLGVEATMEIISEQRVAGGAVVVSTHLVDLAAQACERALVLRGGVVVDDSSSALLAGAPGAARYRELLA
jgi:ABC-2 type transport system ATP-binding protein